ncbi:MULTISPECIES: DUF1868 domain-containing protein [unclassified Rhizobium]|jgi:hypothetical protein|uniref:DUF1868 domain-containing protein n=1 Tax=unclassified Rhizobium TaxID=2613769 RepID=UPI0006470343|nr:MULTISPECIES: DUF1868 domain-containing protein [unclassified Rhizobium]MBN8952730.1 DUF1868 domain-containing protein [Rhizobium tropici]OJY71399.1 MAG: hypothetical protein BGP09_03490 [Rhizobium sp. 60-20]RKD55221.1 hypothetical protein BJ928_11345 [Rhizobium sp. WW_1]
MDFSVFSPDLLKYAKSLHPEPPRHLGTRYDRAGIFQYEPGNTVVCHLTEGSQTEQAIVAARQRYLDMPEASQFAFTPISSLHMTLFQGIIEYRREHPYWPVDLALDTPIAEMTEIMGERQKAFSARDPFKVVVTKARPSGLLVDGATEADRKAMAAWRNALADLLGYRHPDHETYPFHITFAYAIERLADEALPRWQAMLDEVAAALRAEVPLLELRPPAFCSFEDMNYFKELLVFDD